MRATYTATLLQREYNLRSRYTARSKQCCIQQFMGGTSTSVARRKTIVQSGVWGGTVSPPQWGPGAKPWKFFGYFAF